MKAFENEKRAYQQPATVGENIWRKWRYRRLIEKINSADVSGGAKLSENIGVEA